MTKGFWAFSTLAQFLGLSTSVVKKHLKASDGSVTIATFKAPYNGVLDLRVKFMGRETSANLIPNPNGFYDSEWWLRFTGYGDGNYSAASALFNGPYGGPNNGNPVPVVSSDGTFSISQDISGGPPGYEVDFVYSFEQKEVII